MPVIGWPLKVFGSPWHLPLCERRWWPPLALVRINSCLSNLEINGNVFCLGSFSGVLGSTLNVPGRTWKTLTGDGVVERLEISK